MIRVLDNLGKTADRYTIIIDKDLFFLSRDADMPNGVCSYGGEIDEYPIQDMGVEIGLDEIPFGTSRAISNILLGYGY